MPFLVGHKLNIGNKFRQGKIPWNKGIYGVCKQNSGSFKKGLIPWNKDKKGVQIAWNKGMGNIYVGEKNTFFGKKHTKETIEKMRLAKLGKYGPNTNRWKGGYHKGLRRLGEMNLSGNFTKREWEQLKKEYNYMCLCCKQFEPEIKLTADHIVPITIWALWIRNHPDIKFKCGDIENIQPLCMSCNLRKFTKIIDYRVNNLLQIS